MSIFVLNLATLLGLGLGVDYSLLMTSRFREELARAAGRPGRASPDAVRVTVATAGRAVFFCGLTVLLGLLGLVLFEFMILRSVGIAGAIVVGLAVAAALTLLPAILRSSARGSTASRSAGSRPTPATGRAVGAARPAGDAPPGRGARPDAGAPAPARARRSCTSGSTPRTRRSCRPTVPSRAAFDRLDGEFGEGEFAPLVARDPDDRAGDERRPTSPRSTTTRGGSRRTRGSRRVDSLVDVDPRLTLDAVPAALRRPERPARPVRRRRRSAATTKGDLTAFTLYTPYGPNRDEGRALVADLRAPAGPLAPPAGMTVLVGGGAADVDDVVDRVGADFPRTALFIIVTTYLVLFVLLRSVVLPAKALVDEHAVDRGVSFGALVWIFQDGNLSALLGFQPLGLRRDHPAGDPVLRPVRAVDGLRGLPAVADEGGLGPDRRQHRGRRRAASSGAAGSSPRRR